MPGALDSAGLPRSFGVFQSIVLALGEWDDRVVPVQLCPHRNGISKSGPDEGLTATVRAFAGPIRPKSCPPSEPATAAGGAAVTATQPRASADTDRATFRDATTDHIHH